MHLFLTLFMYTYNLVSYTNVLKQIYLSKKYIYTYIIHIYIYIFFLTLRFNSEKIKKRDIY